MDYLIIIALGWFIKEFEPIELGVDYLKQKLPTNPITDYLLGAFSCWMCMTFWSGWIYSGSITTAMLCSLGSLILLTWMQKK